MSFQLSNSDSSNTDGLTAAEKQKKPAPAESESKNTRRARIEELQKFIDPILAPLGLEVVAIETLTGRQNKLQIFIEKSDRDDQDTQSGISLEDCTQATHALDLPLDESPLLEQVFKGSYDLEISSPGLHRPIQKPRDFERYQGRRIKVQTYRSLSSDESKNAQYTEKYPKQKNFIGNCQGFEFDQNAVLLEVEVPGKKQEGFQISIPLEVISKANLEPDLDRWLKETEGKGAKR